MLQRVHSFQHLKWLCIAHVYDKIANRNVTEFHFMRVFCSAFYSIVSRAGLVGCLNELLGKYLVVWAAG